MPRVWPGTSVILAAMVWRPKRWSSSWERSETGARRGRDRISSVWVVKGRACQAMSPAAMACSRRRPASGGGAAPGSS